MMGLFSIFKKKESKTHNRNIQKEAEEAGYQAYMDFAKGSLTPEEAYRNRGFVKDKDGKWVYGKLVTNSDTVKSKEKPFECKTSCKICGKPLRAFHYYRDNNCWTYCEKCGKPYQACYAAPYRTIELMFSGVQREGISISIEIEKWPSLESSSLRWYEWNFGGGYEDRIDLPSNYISEHTVDEFIDEYILKDNKAISHISSSEYEEFLNRSRTILKESGIFKQ